MTHPIRSLAIAAFAFVAGLTAAPAVAEACSCAEPEGPNMVRPGVGDDVVPTNTLVWVFKKRCQARLVDASGADVATDMMTIVGRTHRPEVLVPTQELTMGESYTVVCDDEFAQEPLTHSFTVNAESDLTAPVIGAHGTASCDVESGTNEMCGGNKEIVFDVEHDGAFLVNDVDGEASVNDSGPVVGGSFTDLYIDGDLRLANELCALDNWPLSDTGAELGVPAAVRWGAYDLAGNFSGLTEPAGVCAGSPLPQGPTGEGEAGQVISSGCGCRTVGPNPTRAWPGLLALTGIALCRRRRGHR